MKLTHLHCIRLKEQQIADMQQYLILKKEGKPFKGDTMKLPDIPVEFISFEGDDTVYLLNDRKFKINSEFCKQACNLQPGEIFTINHLLVSVSDLN